jgi:hypothetical protein
MYSNKRITPYLKGFLSSPRKMKEWESTIGITRRAIVLQAEPNRQLLN